MQAIIMAGGKGKRLREVISDIPKPLAPINGEPLLDYIIEHAKNSGCDNIVITTGYLGKQIKDHVEKNNYGIPVLTSRENESDPLETAGSLLLIKDLLEDEFFVLYGDIFTTINLSNMLKFHKQKKSDVTLALHTSDHPQDSTVVRINNEFKILNFVEKPGGDWEKYGNLTATSLYVLKRDILDFIEPNKEIDIAKDIFPKMLKAGKNLFGYLTNEYAKDMGTPERYQKVKEYVRIHQKEFLYD